ncbi:MAG: DNA-3-methyladenine glycosylase I [Gammaproteobacteria bacterium]|nr:DNA-3-methyladenine glycosylase I [Gammaproteobacteria bacterium]
MNAERCRCDWASGGCPEEIVYHDTEWCVPTRDDRTLFEFLLLEGAQAGLSWRTVLLKREGYRRAFADFDPGKVARFKEAKITELLANSAIIRNRLKVRSAVGNARAFLDIQAQYGSFADYLWAFVDGSPIHNHWRTRAEVPASSPLSEQLSKALKRRGFRFAGSTICYSYMQAAGLLNDHLTTCFRHAEVAQLPSRTT